MIYGINFNGTEIPPAIKRKFAAATDKNGRSVGKDRGCAWRLVGVATTPEDRDNMLAVANNGRRQLRVVERKTAGGPFFGIYAG